MVRSQRSLHGGCAPGCPAPQNLQSRALPSTLRAPRPAAASRLSARSSPRIVCPALLAPSAVRVHLQPAAELGHVQRHKHVRHVLRAPLTVPKSAVPPSHLHDACTARARSPPPACRRHAQLAAHREPCLRPRQWASAFNQPLSWDTRRVTHMRNMFYVRCSPRPDPASLCSRAHPPASSRTRSGALLHAVGRRLTPPGPQLAPHRLPCLRPRQDAITFNQPLSWDTSGVTDMSYMFQVHSPAALPPSAIKPSHTLLDCVHRDRARTSAGKAAASCIMPLIPRPPSVRLGRAQTLCPPPTSCASAARGRAPPHSRPLAMSRIGIQNG